MSSHLTSFRSAPAQPAPAAPAAAQTAPDQFTNSTKFNDLPDAARAAIEGIECVPISRLSPTAIADRRRTFQVGHPLAGSGFGGAQDARFGQGDQHHYLPVRAILCSPSSSLSPLAPNWADSFSPSRKRLPSPTCCLRTHGWPRSCDNSSRWTSRTWQKLQQSSRAIRTRSRRERRPRPSLTSRSSEPSLLLCCSRQGTDWCYSKDTSRARRTSSGNGSVVINRPWMFVCLSLRVALRLPDPLYDSHSKSNTASTPHTPSRATRAPSSRPCERNTPPSWPSLPQLLPSICS